MKKIFPSILIAFLIIFLLGSRLYKLDQFPVGLTHDETVYAIQAKSLAVQNTNTFQNLGWFSLQPIHSMYAEWPASLMAPFFWLTENPILATHLLPAVMGILMPFSLAWLVWGIWKDKKLSLAIFAVSIFSPLLWQFSRLSFDSIFSVFFYIMAGAILMNLKGWWKLLSLPIFIIGFFQYQGMKLLLLPWVGSLVLLDFASDDKITRWNYFVQKLSRYLIKPISAVFYSTFLITLVYGFLILPNQNVNNRLSKTIFTDNQEIAEQVDTQRRLSLTSPMNQIFSNKVSQTGLFMSKSFLSAFSPKLLFIETEPQVSGFAVWSHGVFYLIDGVLILIGLFALFHLPKTRLQGLVLIIMPIIFSLPSVINTLSEWYLLRQMLAYLTLIIIISYGVRYLSRFNKLKWLFLLIYIVSITNFIYQFYFRYPVYAADSQEVQERVIAKYIALSQEQDPLQQFTVYTPEPERYFASYLLYSNGLTERSKDLVAEAYREEKYEIGAIEFVSGCVDLSRNGVIIGDILQLACSEEELEAIHSHPQAIDEKVIENALSIPAVSDSGEEFLIYNDTLCQPHQMKAHFAPNRLDNFNMENMFANQFCYEWITDLRDLK